MLQSSAAKLSILDVCRILLDTPCNVRCLCIYELKEKSLTSDSNEPAHYVNVGLLKIKNLKVSKPYSGLTQAPKMQLFERIVHG